MALKLTTIAIHAIGLIGSLCLTLVVQGQNRYFLGVDIGPKVDIYRLASGGSRPYDPSLSVENDLGAFFGVNGGVLVENKIMVETGLYRSNFRAVIDIVNEDGQHYFQNTPINTFTAWFLPVNFNIRKPWRDKPNQFWYAGFGTSTLVGIKRGVDQYISHGELVDPSDINQGTIGYSITSNSFDAKIITLNGNAGIHYPINASVVANFSISVRLGVAGNNFIDIDHETPDYPSVKNTIYTSGSGAQLQFGFRYFLDDTE
ncbi:MAG: hypothetical protein KDC76_12465 [Bacteroidetes bacterium]|nr:hypothetical protein [Bacteroidota bacterium]